MTPTQLTDAMAMVRRRARRCHGTPLGYEDAVGEGYLAAVTAILDEVERVGHNDNCLFCGFKDRAIARYRAQKEAGDE